MGVILNKLLFIKVRIQTVYLCQLTGWFKERVHCVSEGIIYIHFIWHSRINIIIFLYYGFEQTIKYHVEILVSLMNRTADNGKFFMYEINKNIYTI